MEKKKVSMSTFLIIVGIIVIGVLSCYLVILNQNKSNIELEKKQLEENTAKMQEQVQILQKEKNELQDKIDIITNTITNKNTIVDKTTQTEPKDEGIVKELFIKYIQKMDSQNDEKLQDYTIDNIEIVTGSKTIKELYPNAETTDIFANVIYSVKPSNVNKSNWIAGNGDIEGDWIKNKSACVHIIKNNGNYEIKSSGTGW